MLSLKMVIKNRRYSILIKNSELIASEINKDNFLQGMKVFDRADKLDMDCFYFENDKFTDILDGQEKQSVFNLYVSQLK